MKIALEKNGAEVAMVWHGDTSLPESDLVVLPGGFSYGDYLRCGAMAAHSPIVREVKKFAEKGGYVLGVCNGFQVLCETGLLPGVLMRNQDLRFICREVNLNVTTTESDFTSNYQKPVIRIPIAHHDGNYRIDDEGLKALNEEDRVAFRYATAGGAVNDNVNPNGSVENIAGVLSANRRVLGMMPHPERYCDEALGGTDGNTLFASLITSL